MSQPLIDARRRKLLTASTAVAASPFMFNIARAQGAPIKIGFPVPLTGAFSAEAQDQVRAAAIALADEIAGSAPLAVQSTRATLRRGLLDELRNAVARESEAQNQQFLSADFKEGVAAMTARRAPQFQGR